TDEEPAMSAAVTVDGPGIGQTGQTSSSPSLGREVLAGVQGIVGALRAPFEGALKALARVRGKAHADHGDCGCAGKAGCDDCHCRCNVCDADVVAYVRCGEDRIIPLTFENQTRRDKSVKLDLSTFTDSSG